MKSTAKSKRSLPNLKQKAFLAAYAKCGNLTEASRKSKVARDLHYDWLRDDPAYPAAFAIAHEEAGDHLESEARRRAVEGVPKPVIYQGQLCREAKRDKNGELIRNENGEVVFSAPLTIREYSDTLLIFLMKGNNPEKYRDNAKVEHTGPGGGPLEVTVQFVSAEKPQS